MRNILAKSSGQNLIDHSILVSKFAVEIANQTLLNNDERLIKIIKLSSLLHDIGKCTDFFQNKLKKGVFDEQIDDTLPKSKKFRHNEISWAFLSRYLTFLNKEDSNKVLNMVYWHHGISNIFGNYKDTDVIKDLTEKEISTMVSFIEFILNDQFDNLTFQLEEKDYNPKNAPKFYDNGEDNVDVNSENLFIRSCVISADRLASKYENASDDEIKKIVSEYNIVDYNINLEKHVYNGSKRFLKQIEIIGETKRTTQLNAPGGFGKTLLGLLWAIKQNKRVIWVCPTNVIANSVYKTLMEELTLFGDNEITVELFYTNEVKDSNHKTLGFDSNIIVTNIDNYLTPSINNSVASRLYTIINSDVIFDEFHELVGRDSALFASFINIMRTRNRLTSSNTLLLSATPTNMHNLWDSVGSKTLILPEKHKHFKAPHDVKFHLNVTTDEIAVEKDTSSLIIMNSIKESQLKKDVNHCELLLHSEFVKKDRDENFKRLYSMYGKTSQTSITKSNVMGTPLIQASLDISFNRLYESVLSPQTTGQRIPRCNRWGTYSEPYVSIHLTHNPSEVSMRKILYTNNLSNSWFSHLKKYNQKKLSYDEFYVVYNEFESNNEKILITELRDVLSNSLDCLSLIYPIVYFNKTKSKNISAGGNKLRSNGNNIFVIAAYHNDNEKFTEPFSVTMRKSFAEEFDENANTQKKIENTWKLLRDNNDSRFDFNEMITTKKYISQEAIQNKARKIETPYIRFDKVYHEKYGLIRLTDLELLTQ
jgi:CRISPR-associated endonuclease/helicase Cas3